MELDEVHRGHGEPGAVDHAPDLAVEGDVVEIVPARLDLRRILLVLVAQARNLPMAVEGVVVEAHLGVERHHPARAGHDERVDLDDARVELDERAVQARDELRPRARRAAGKAEPERHAASVKGL